MKKEVSEIVKKLFEEEIFEEHFNSEKNFLNLSKLLKEQVENISERENISTDVIREEIITVAEKHPLFFDIARNQKDRRKILNDIFSDHTEVNQHFLNKVALNIIEAYKGKEFNINTLYRKINQVDTIEDKKHIINDNIARFLTFNKEHELKEALGVINTFIEVSEFSKSDIDELWDKSYNDDTNIHYQNFVSKIIKEVNNTSLIDYPFTVQKRAKKLEVNYNKKTSGLYDHFMYSPKSKRFGLNFSTANDGTEIEGDSIIKHSLSFLSTLYYLESWFEFDQLENPSVDKVRELLYATYTGYCGEDEFNKCLNQTYYEKLLEDKQYNIPKDPIKFKKELQRSLKGANRHLDFFIRDFIMAQKSEFPKDKINIEDIYDKDELDSDFNKFQNEYSSDFSHHHIYNINHKQLDQLFSLIKSKFDIYYFGEVKSNRSKDLIYQEAEKFTNEELRAGLNMLAYTGKNSEGVLGINISAEGLYNFFDKIKTRFNTSTKSKNNCLDIEKVDKNFRAIGKIFIENYILNEDIKEVLKNYKKENNQIIKNISNFEKNILLQISDKISNTKCSPQKALSNVLNNFDIKENIKFDDFIDRLKNKWRKIQNSSLSENNTHIIEGLSLQQDKYLLQKEVFDMKAQLKDSATKPK
tara:strand:+ start:4430 stop:6352 length:1923 start_codon:yes stop_codon:yes gene_type:complete